MAVRRSVFEQVGGFDCNLAVSFNDTVFCLDVMALGYQSVCIGDALMIHHESKSRGYDDTPEKRTLAHAEAIKARSRHSDFFKNDPFYNPNLSLTNFFELAYPPRDSKFWRAFNLDFSNLNSFG